MSQIHHHELLAAIHPWRPIKKCHQLEFVMTAGNTSMQIPHGLTLDHTKCGMIYGGWRADATTNYSQLCARYTLDNTNINVDKVNASANDVTHNVSIVEYEPWACTGKKSYSVAASDTSAEIYDDTIDSSLGQSGFFLPFYCGHSPGATNQNIENSSFYTRLFEGYTSEISSYLYAEFLSSATWTNGMTINFDVLWFGSGSGDPQQSNLYSRNRFIYDNPNNWGEAPWDIYVSSTTTSQTSHNDFNGTNTLFKRDVTMNLPMGINNKNFQNAMLMANMSDDDTWEITANVIAEAPRRISLFPVALDPRLIKKKINVVLRIDNDADTTDLNLSALGFTNLDKMTIAHLGSNTNNPYSNLYGWTTAKLLDDSGTLKARVQRNLTGFSIWTDTAIEVIEYW